MGERDTFRNENFPLPKKSLELFLFSMELTLINPYVKRHILGWHILVPLKINSYFVLIEESRPWLYSVLIHFDAQWLVLPELKYPLLSPHLILCLSLKTFFVFPSPQDEVQNPWVDLGDLTSCLLFLFLPTPDSNLYWILFPEDLWEALLQYGFELDSLASYYL